MDAGTANGAQSASLYWMSYDGLTWIDRTGKLQPALASSWKTADAKTWDFTLRNDIKFHDGSPLAADDVVGTFNHYRDLTLKPPLLVSANWGNADTVTAVDQSTVRIVLKAPDPAFAKRVGFSMVLPWRTVTKMGQDAFFKAPLGTGPYRLVPGTDTKQTVNFQAMPSSFVNARGSAASVPNLQINFIASEAGKLAAFKTGEIDVAILLTPDDAEALRATGATISLDPGTSSINFNIDQINGPTKDVRVRQAINLAVDRDSILKNVNHGYGTLDAQLLGTEVSGYNPDVKPYPYDVAMAKQLLAQAGVPNGFDIDLTTIMSATIPQPVTESIGSFLGKVGINAKINVKEIGAWIGSFQAGPEARPGLYVQPVNWDPTYEPDSAWRKYSKTQVPPESGGFSSDDAFDKMYQAAKQTVDDTKRAQMYQQAGVYFHNQAPVLFLWRVPRPAGVGKGIKFNAGYYADTYTTALSKG